MLIPKRSDSIEISVRKKQEKGKFLFVGELKPKPNQRVFELDLNTFELTECKYTSLSKTINYLEALHNTIFPKNRTIIIKENYDYVIKLNINNAKKYFDKKYNCDCIIIKNEVLLERKQKKINMFKKT